MHPALLITLFLTAPQQPDSSPSQTEHPATLTEQPTQPAQTGPKALLCVLGKKASASGRAIERNEMVLALRARLPAEYIDVSTCRLKRARKAAWSIRIRKLADGARELQLTEGGAIETRQIDLKGAVSSYERAQILTLATIDALRPSFARREIRLSVPEPEPIALEKAREPLPPPEPRVPLGLMIAGGLGVPQVNPTVLMQIDIAPSEGFIRPITSASIQYLPPKGDPTSVWGLETTAGLGLRIGDGGLVGIVDGLARVSYFKPSGAGSKTSLNGGVRAQAFVSIHEGDGYAISLGGGAILWWRPRRLIANGTPLHTQSHTELILGPKFEFFL